MKRIIAFILSALMLVSVFAACGDQADPPVTDPPKSTDGGATVTTEPPITEPPVTTKHVADVPDVTYDGADFTIMVSGNVTYRDFSYQDTTTVLENAIYLRNENIQERFNVEIVTEERFAFGQCYGAGPGYTFTRRGHTSGENGYDLSFLGTHDASTCAMQGYLENLNDVPYIVLGNEWWDQKANDQMTLNGNMFYTTGNIITVVDTFTFTILFNKRMAAEHKLDLYSLVKEGKWTVDEWGSATRLVSEDVNGDDKMNENDKYGSLVWNDALLGVINSCGGAIGMLNDAGELELTLYNDQVLAMVEKYCETAYTDYCFNWQTLGDAAGNPMRNKMFLEDRALFMLHNVNLTSTGFRDSETLEYGFLPYFKLDESQKEYACHIQEGACYFLCVPVMTVDMEKTGIITEAMACESYYLVKPAFFEKQLVGTYIQDEESDEILEIIFASRLFDVGAFYQVGGYTTGVIRFFGARRNDFASFYESSRAKAESDLKRINSLMDNNVLGE